MIKSVIRRLTWRPCPDCPRHRGRHGLIDGGCTTCGTTGRVRRFGRGR